MRLLHCLTCRVIKSQSNHFNIFISIANTIHTHAWGLLFLQHYTIYSHFLSSPKTPRFDTWSNANEDKVPRRISECIRGIQTST
mmetsp:Transcript_3330/g.8124  ORF Transcript_3330/g.8124 Transcript_3330/m.8124 type:complete len:84 (-) Transcript_3330:190-441(-)